MENGHQFFENPACKYFPCHEIPAGVKFNCLFCYCPLYAFGDRCGGNFKYSGDKRTKICTDCNLPHIPAYYNTITARLKERLGTPLQGFE